MKTWLVNGYSKLFTSRLHIQHNLTTPFTPSGRRETHLQPMRRREERLADVTTERGATCEGVLDEMSLKMSRAGRVVRAKVTPERHLRRVERLLVRLLLDQRRAGMPLGPMLLQLLGVLELDPALPAPLRRRRLPRAGRDAKGVGRVPGVARGADVVLAVVARRGGQVPEAEVAAARALRSLREDVAQMVLRVHATLELADEGLPADDAGGGEVGRGRDLRPGLGLLLLKGDATAVQAVGLQVLQELALGGEGAPADDADVAVLDLAVLLELVLGEAGARG